MLGIDALKCFHLENYCTDSETTHQFSFIKSLENVWLAV